MMSHTHNPTDKNSPRHMKLIKPLTSAGVCPSLDLHVAPVILFHLIMTWKSRMGFLRTLTKRNVSTATRLFINFIQREDVNKKQNKTLLYFIYSSHFMEWKSVAILMIYGLFK